MDLADLRPFFLNSLTVNHRRAHEDAEGLAFRTPDAWTRHDPAVLESYRGLHFERNRPGRAASDRLLGVGHRLVGHALKEGLAFSAGVACVAPDLIVHPVFVYRVQDRVTGDTGTTANQILAMRIPETGSPEVLRDWELLRLLNAAPAGQWSRRWASDAAAQVREAMVVRATEACTARLQAHPGSFRVPTAALIGVLWPGSKAAPDVAEGGGEGADLDEPPGA